MGRKDKCPVCESVVAKTSSAVRCSRCNGWVHQACAGLEDEALAFMKKRIRGFCWFCEECIDDTEEMLRAAQTAADVQKNIIQSVVEQMSDTLTDFKLEMSVKMKSLEDQINTTGGIGQVSAMKPQTFANIVKEAISESRTARDLTGGDAVEVVDQGRSKTIYSQQVLVVKLKLRLPRKGLRVPYAQFR